VRHGWERYIIFKTQISHGPTPEKRLKRELWVWKFWRRQSTCPQRNGRRTEMTLLNPSSTSLSFRLSSSFLICAAGSVLMELRELLADWAASRVSSRAAVYVSRCTQHLKSFQRRGLHTTFQQAGYPRYRLHECSSKWKVASCNPALGWYVAGSASEWRLLWEILLLASSTHPQQTSEVTDRRGMGKSIKNSTGDYYAISQLTL
jgi:hypothetical protein